jgi:hypothetical protein
VGILLASSDASGVALLILVPVAIYLLAAIGFGFGGRSIMRSKGRSGSAGFCLGFFLGLVGLLIAALLSPTPQHEAERMRLQMAVMGIAVPSTPATAVDGQRPGLSGVGVGASPRVVSPIIGRIALGLAVVALVAETQNFTYAGVAVVLTLAAFGLALSALVMSSANPRIDRPRWLAPTTIAGAVIISLVTLDNRPYDGVLWVADIVTFGLGAALAAITVVRARRGTVSVAVGWSAIAFLLLLDQFHELGDIDFASAWALVLVIIIGFGVAGVWMARQPASAHQSGGRVSQLWSAAPAQSVESAPTSAHWGADPFGRHQHRFHHGTSWTAHVSTNGVTGTDAPIDTPVSPPTATRSAPTAAERDWWNQAPPQR